MSTTAAALTTTTLLAAALVLAACGWRLHGSRVVAGGLVVVAAALAVVLNGTDPAFGQGLEELSVVAVLGLLAVFGGGPVTAATFRLVDGPGAPAAGSTRRAAEVLRGGAWIGALERLAIFAALLSGWPEGLALTLALKGLGRYPELRHEERAGIAERFLIGTFVSVLWACACAGLALLAL
ncbi:hypothetical protein [Nocardioides daphniae]|uniref:Uncharacterized protein n=1 Tax=Nocardioides daphniae TaxID=402297 RepID=A0A4P7UCD0_9ACTN|nr:hypothetical protein [Nocardioides daphniae]QCC76948.1 hypothetical protein E2C04_06435 [Nocardioides daphniae]GGD17983.1 hypothetical protein GCM10007231_16310 [Nocardioides daphniae]